jgi:hypothetical protein
MSQCVYQFSVDMKELLLCWTVGFCLLLFGLLIFLPVLAVDWTICHLRLSWEHLAREKTIEEWEDGQW